MNVYADHAATTPMRACAKEAMLEALEENLGRRCVAASDRRRLVKGMELVAALRRAAKLNANPGQLAGWLCAGMFS